MIEIGVDFLRLVLGEGRFNFRHAVNDTNKEEFEIKAGIFRSIVKTLLYIN